MSWNIPHDCIAGSVGNGDDWAQETLSATFATVNGSIELQNLKKRSREQSTACSNIAARSEQTHWGPSGESVGNEQGEDFIDKRATLERRQHTEEYRLLSSQESQEIIIHNNSDVDWNGNSVLSNNTSHTGHSAVAEGEIDLESQRLIAPSDVSDNRARSRGSSLDDDEADDRMQEARRLEDSTEVEEDDTQFRIRISRSRIHWGVVPMPEEFYAQFGQQEDGIKLGHLSFGIEEQGVAPPENDPKQLYA